MTSSGIVVVNAHNASPQNGSPQVPELSVPEVQSKPNGTH